MDRVEDVVATMQKAVAALKTETYKPDLLKSTKIASIEMNLLAASAPGTFGQHN